MVRPEDMATARKLVRDWAPAHSTFGELGQLSGMIAAALADAYWRGRGDGFTAGRRSQADAIRDLLALGEDQ